MEKIIGKIFYFVEHLSAEAGLQSSAGALPALLFKLHCLKLQFE